MAPFKNLHWIHQFHITPIPFYDLHYQHMHFSLSHLVLFQISFASSYLHFLTHTFFLANSTTIYIIYSFSTLSVAIHLFLLSVPLWLQLKSSSMLTFLISDERSINWKASSGFSQVQLLLAISCIFWFYFSWDICFTVHLCEACKHRNIET